MVHSSYFIRGYADPRLRRRARLQREPRMPARPARRRAARSSTGCTSATGSSCIPSAVTARETLVEELRRHALVLGEVTLTSGATAQYYVDAKRAILRPAGFARSPSWSPRSRANGAATAVGGLTMGADAPACAALAGGADVKAFFVRKEVKAHGLQRRIEGPPLEPGRALPDRRGRGHDRRLDAPGHRGRARRGPRGLRRASRSSTAWRAGRRRSRGGRRRALRGARHDRRHPPRPAHRAPVTPGPPM